MIPKRRLVPGVLAWSAALSLALLVLGDDGLVWTEHPVKRHRRLREEIRRVVGSSFYPVIHKAPLPFAPAIVLMTCLGTMVLWKRS